MHTANLTTLLSLANLLAFASANPTSCDEPAPEPLETTPGGLVVIDVVTLSSGAEIPLGFPSHLNISAPAYPEEPYPEPAGPNDCGNQIFGDVVYCSGSEAFAPANACARLISALNANPEPVLPISPRMICAETEEGWEDRYNSDGKTGNLCCAGWSQDIPGAERFWLVPALGYAFGWCTADMRTSGLSFDVNVKGVCLSECVDDGSKECVDMA